MTLPAPAVPAASRALAGVHRMLKFWLCFVPLFVAVNALGTLPIFVTITEGLGRRQVRFVILQSVVTAMVVAMAFLLAGRGFLSLMGITVADFMVAGGALLFVLSLSDMLATDEHRRQMDPEAVGAVPLGVPLIVGPAVMTTSLLLLGQYGTWPAVTATLLNIVLAGVVFSMSGPFMRLLGKAGAKTLSKVASLLLATVGVMIVRKGLMAFLSGGAAV
jgi:multiple antibiotic resistance protein